MRSIVAGNWKMNLTAGQARELAGAVVRDAEGLTKTGVWVAPSFPSLGAVREVTKGTGVELGALPPQPACLF